jgi:hypothetical protein
LQRFFPRLVFGPVESFHGFQRRMASDWRFFCSSVHCLGMSYLFKEERLNHEGHNGHDDIQPRHTRCVLCVRCGSKLKQILRSSFLKRFELEIGRKDKGLGLQSARIRCRGLFSHQ